MPVSMVSRRETSATKPAPEEEIEHANRTSCSSDHRSARPFECVAASLPSEHELPRRERRFHARRVCSLRTSAMVHVCRWSTQNRGRGLPDRRLVDSRPYLASRSSGLCPDGRGHRNALQSPGLAQEIHACNGRPDLGGDHLLRRCSLNDRENSNPGLQLGQAIPERSPIYTRI